MTVVIAAFDLDDTLLDGDSDRSWRTFLVEEGLLSAELERQRSDEFYQAYLAGRLDAAACSQFAVEPLVGASPATLAELQKRFCERHIQPMIKEPALELIDNHRRQSHNLVIITSTCRFVSEGAAGLLGIEHLLATELEWRDGMLTGKVDGQPCYREGKNLHLGRWADREGLGLEGAWFYSDSSNDLALLNRLDNPVAVNPDPTLEEEADRQGWPILNLRQGAAVIN